MSSKGDNADGFFFGFVIGKHLKECGWLGDTMANFAISKVGASKGLRMTGRCC